MQDQTSDKKKEEEQELLEKTKDTKTEAERVFGVSLSCEFQQINDVDQTFDAVGYVHVSWKQPGLKDAEGVDFKEVSSQCIYSDAQDLLFLNANTTKVTDTTTTIEDETVEAVFGYETKVGEVLDFRRFPFDRQVFQLVLQNQNDFPSFRFESMAPSYVTLLGALPTNWTLEEPELGTVQSTEEGEEGKPNCVLRIRLERKPSYFIWTVAFPLFIITSIMLSAWVLPIDSFDVRMSIILTLLLTAVAFKYVVSSFIPKVGYMTLLDYYVLISFTLLGVGVVEVTVMYLLRDYEVVQEIDHWFAVSLTIIWFLYNIILWILVAAKRLFVPWEKVDEMYSARRKRIEKSATRYSSSETKIRQFA